MHHVTSVYYTKRTGEAELMGTSLQLLFVTGLTAFLGFVVYLIRKKALSLQYTLLWLLSILVMLIISIFPGVLTYISHFLGFQLESNAVFSLVLGLCIIILLSLTSIVSRQSDKIKTLIQTIALLENRLRDVED